MSTGELKRAAAEIVAVAERIRAIGHRTAALLSDRELNGSVLRSPVTGVRAQGALLRAVTHRTGLGFAFGGVTGRLGGMAGQESLAARVAVTSLRLRIDAVALEHPELLDDPSTRRLVNAVLADRDLEATRTLRAMFKRRGASSALSSIAPIAMEVLAIRALQDENPFNDGSGWSIATGKQPEAEPLLGISTRAVTHWDTGEGAAEPAELEPEIASSGGLIAFLSNIAVLRTNGRVLLQSVLGPDGVTRYVVHAPGMDLGSPVNDTPQDFVGAGRNAMLGDSPYVRALGKAIVAFGVPAGAELALVGHSEGGAAVMNLAQDARFCARYRVTHAVCVGSPIDFKVCADPETWVASVTNQHDIVPALDGVGAGTCFDLHPDWYVVDYTEASHRFPQCHSIAVYLRDLRELLHEEREHIDSQISRYHGPVTRSQAYRLRDREVPR
ncbi:hypothetical protein ACIBG8_12870 [Nonomuraea sp. NPDC050556]|uniref:hypothetical protein n=1 Tax=Nonomuraea sp. NPDC050556 TaxID=3364369 RepID=UPI0037A8BD8B